MAACMAMAQVTARSVIFHIAGRTEGCKYRITQKLVYRAAVLKDDVRHLTEVAIEECDYLLWGRCSPMW